MADIMRSSQTAPQLTPDAFLADRMHFWGAFTSFATGAVISIVVLLILMAIFLV